MRRLISQLLIVLLFMSVAVCFAQPTDASLQDNKLHLVLMPYLIAPGMSGEATVNGERQPINASAGDIFSNLQLGFMARMRLNYNRLFLGTDTVYMGLGGANNLVDVGFDQWAAELLSGYHIQRNVTFLGGVRYNSLSTNVRFKGPLGANPSGSQLWWDPFLGGEAALPLTSKTNLSARFDVGGFGVGSRIAVNSEPLLNYQFSERYRGTVGWKFLYQDYVNNAEAFEYDVLTQGPVFGFAIRW